MPRRADFLFAVYELVAARRGVRHQATLNPKYTPGRRCRQQRDECKRLISNEKTAVLSRNVGLIAALKHLFFFK